MTDHHHGRERPERRSPGGETRGGIIDGGDSISGHTDGTVEHTTRKSSSKRRTSALIAVKNAVLHHGSPLSPNARILAIVLADHMFGGETVAYPSVATIASLAGIGERTARAKPDGPIEELEKAGFLAVTYGRGREITNQYTLKIPDNDCPGGARCKCAKTGNARRLLRSENRQDSPLIEDGKPADAVQKTGKPRDGKPAKSAKKTGRTCRRNVLLKRSHEKRAAEANETDPARASSVNEGATPSRPTPHTPNINAVAERYVETFNLVHGRRWKVTPMLKDCIEACLNASPPYSEDEMIAAALMSWGDEWYTEREPSYPLRFRRAGKEQGKSHLDDLLAQIAPGKRHASQLVALVKQVGMAPYFKERTRP